MGPAGRGLVVECLVSLRGQLAGRTLAGRFEVLDRIGVGGMGEVYRARDRELDELVALKVIRDELLALPGVLERFRTEVKLARRVTHRSVARAYELVVTADISFYTMELIVGVSLETRMARRRVIEIGEAASIATALCDALGAAHAAGIVHRDVKPENILLAEDGRIVLTDFGIAAAVRDGEGELAGTPRYMAPEQAAGADPTPAADVFALGVVLYEMLTGAAAFTGANLAEITAQRQGVDHLDIPGIDPRLADLVARATARDPAVRIPTATAFRRLIAPFARDAARDRDGESSIRRAPALPTVIVRAPHDDGEAPSRHLIEGFHQAVVDRLAEWPRLRVVTSALDDVVGSAVVQIASADEEVEITAAFPPQALVLRLPFDADALQRSAEQAARLLATLMGSEASPPVVHGRALPGEALELILRARHVARRDRRQLGAAIAWCERALELAPGHPRVTATLATCQAQASFYAAYPPANILDTAERHALSALAADPGVADAHFARAHVELHRGRPVTAAVCFRAAIARAPLMAEAHEWLGRMLLEAGFGVDAHARLDNASSLGPIEGLRWIIAVAAALDSNWELSDRTIHELRETAVATGAIRLRLALWRGRQDVARDTYAELATLPKSAMFDGELILALYDPETPWRERRDRVVALAVDRGVTSARRRAFLGQLAAEAAGAAGDVDTCLVLLLHSNAHGLFDVGWLDRCPVLASARGEPRFAIIRGDVAARAEAIQDALYGEHRDQATVATQLASR